jgi:hypothetical protein
LTVGAYVNWQLTLEYERNVEVYFNYADRASDAKTKSSYFNQYMEALEKYDLIQGCNAIYFCEQPNASLEKNYIVAKSLQNRLTELSLLDEKETAYQLGMTQMTENEFCWFPTGTFYQKYMLDRGGWGVAITPEYPTDLCN